MRHICLFPWYFKERLLAEGKEIYGIKEGTNVCSLVADINLTFIINFIVISNSMSVIFLLSCKVRCFTEKKYFLPITSLFFGQKGINIYGSKEPLKTSFATEIFHN